VDKEINPKLEGDMRQLWMEKGHKYREKGVDKFERQG